MRAIGLDQPLHMQPSDGHCCCYSKNSCCCGFCYRCSCSCSYLHSGFLQVQAPLLRGARYSAALQPAPAPAPVLPNRQLYPALDAAGICPMLARLCSTLSQGFIFSRRFWLCVTILLQNNMAIRTWICRCVLLVMPCSPCQLAA